MQKIALPTERNILCQHFGHCPEFTIVTIENGQILGAVVLPAPMHEHGSHPNFLAEHGCTDVIAGGIGEHAVHLLTKVGIRLHAGAPAAPVMDVVRSFVDGTIIYGSGECNHKGCGGHHHQ